MLTCTSKTNIYKESLFEPNRGVASNDRQSCGKASYSVGLMESKCPKRSHQKLIWYLSSTHLNAESEQTAYNWTLQTQPAASDPT